MNVAWKSRLPEYLCCAAVVAVFGYAAGWMLYVAVTGLAILGERIGLVK